MSKRKKGVTISYVVAGVAISVIAFLFQQGLLELKTGPDLRITEAYSINEAITNFDMKFKFEVFNQGNKVAENCQINFDNDVNDDVEGRWSWAFSVKPSLSYELEFDKIRYPKADKYVYETFVKCENHSPTKPVRYSIDIEGR